MARPLVIIECASNLGLKPPRPGHEPGVKKLPAFLSTLGLQHALRPEKLIRLTAPSYSFGIDPETGIRNADAIAAFALEQSAYLKPVMAAGQFALVIGGDCSILIGHGLALKECGRYGLFFLDGHTDYAWPGLSQTGGAGGMDFALVTGRGAEKLTNINNRKPYFRPEDCLNAGNRYYGREYTEAITSAGIPYFPLDRMRREGVEFCVRGFLHQVEKQNLDGFWIHVDADVLNNEIMPAVDSPAPDGLWYEEFHRILRPLLSHPKAAGLELTIIDPELDPDGRYSRIFVKEMIDLFHPFISAPHPSPGDLP